MLEINLKGIESQFVEGKNIIMWANRWTNLFRFHWFTTKQSTFL